MLENQQQQHQKTEIKMKSRVTYIVGLVA